jgi:DNA-binding GntR family transcriptional regulator
MTQESRPVKSPTVETTADRAPDASQDGELVLLPRTLSRQIVTRLREEIIAGKWAPGERLPSNVLCARFGVSHIPIREAFKVLESEGFVVLMPNRAAVVTDPTPQDLEGKLQVLDALEALAAAIFCESAADAALKDLAQLHAEMELCHRRGDTSGYHRLNTRIHQHIVRATRNQTLADFHDTLSRHIERARYLAQIRDAVTPVSLRQHKKLLAAMLRRDSIGARQAMEEHRATVRRILVAGTLERSGVKPAPSTRRRRRPPQTDA